MSLGLNILLIVIKALFVLFGAVLPLAALNTWIERKASALIQDRQGANRASILGYDLAGLLNTLIADPVKALLKEDFLPKGTSQFIHSMGPFMAVFPILISFAVVPFGPPFVANGQEISLQVAHLNAGILYVFAMGSLAVYGVVLAGWVSNNKFSLFGGLRASAQMISYEITLGLSIVGVIASYGTLELDSIVELQSGTLLGFLPRWGLFLTPFHWIACLLFFVSMMAETKRAPFDLPESESELVAGYFTEYSGMKFLLFWLGEFAEIVVASTLVVLLFFGGWQLPYLDIRKIPSDLWGFLPLIFLGLAGIFMISGLVFAKRVLSRALFIIGAFALFGLASWLKTVAIDFPWPSLIGAMIFGAKVGLFCVLQIVIRWTLPRFRYDQLMDLCWKRMLPLALVNLVLTVAFLLWRRGGGA